MGDSLSYPEEDDISRYGHYLTRSQTALGVATAAHSRFDRDVGDGGGDIEETGNIVLKSIQRLVTAVMYGDERDVEIASEDVQNAVVDLEEYVEEAAEIGDNDKVLKGVQILGEAKDMIEILPPPGKPIPSPLSKSLQEQLVSFDKGNLNSVNMPPALNMPPAQAKYIGNKIQRDGWRKDIEKKRDEINKCRRSIKKAMRNIKDLKMEIRKDKFKSIAKGTAKQIKDASEYFQNQLSESKIPSVGGTLKAEGTLPVGDRLSDGSKGSAFFHSIIGCEDKEDFEHEFNIANRFFKKQYGLDFSDENPEVVKDGLKRTIGDVVTMEPFGLNHKITHKVETANMHIGELSPAGSDVYDGGFKVEVKQPIELGGNFEREAEDAVVPAGTKMLHGYMDLMDASGDNSAVRIAYRTKQPIVASGGNTYSMVGNLVSHEAPKLAIKRTLYVNKKGGDNHVVMATEFGH